MKEIRFFSHVSRTNICFFEKPGLRIEWSRPKMLVGKRDTLHFLPKIFTVPTMPGLTLYKYKVILLPFWLGHLYFVTYDQEALRKRILKVAAQND